MRKFIIFSIFVISVFGNCTIEDNTLKLKSISKDTKQLIVVTTKEWQSASAVLQRYEKIKNSWREVGKKIDVFIGTNGLAWGRGVCKLNQESNLKVEGDKKAPAGIFTLGRAFGYEDEKFKYNYLRVDKNFKCVDDSNSKYYNKIVNSKEIEVDYKSFEEMRRDDGLYSLGIVVNHNSKAINRGGSCIFIHIKNDSPTLGCSAMKKDELREIIEWLDGDKNPLLIQLPENIFKTLNIR